MESNSLSDLAERPHWIPAKLITVADLQQLLTTIPPNCWVEVNPTILIQVYTPFRDKMGWFDLEQNKFIYEDEG